MLAETIQRLRKEKGLSQEQLATALGVSRQAVSKWETGESVPETEKIIALSQLFGVTTDLLLLGEQQKPAPPPRKPWVSATLAVLGAAGLLTLWILSTIIQSRVPVTIRDNHGSTWYTTEWGYGFWSFIETYRLEAVFALCIVLVVVGGVVYLWRKRHPQETFWHWLCNSL